MTVADVQNLLDNKTNNILVSAKFKQSLLIVHNSKIQYSQNFNLLEIRFSGNMSFFKLDDKL